MKSDDGNPSSVKDIQGDCWVLANTGRRRLCGLSGAFCGQHGSSTNVIINACNISQKFFDRSGKLLRFCFFKAGTACRINGFDDS